MKLYIAGRRGLIFVFLMLLFVGCQTTAANLPGSPTSEIESKINAFKIAAAQEDWKSISKLISSSDRAALAESKSQALETLRAGLSNPVNCLTKYEISEIRSAGDTALVLTYIYVPSNLTNSSGIINFLIGTYKYLGQDNLCAKARAWQVNRDLAGASMKRGPKPTQWYLVKEGGEWRIFLGFAKLAELIKYEAHAKEAMRDSDFSRASELYQEIQNFRHPFDDILLEKQIASSGIHSKTEDVLNEIRDRARREYNALDRRKNAHSYQDTFLEISHEFHRTSDARGEIHAEVSFVVKNNGLSNIKYLLINAHFEDPVGKHVSERRVLVVNNLDHEGKQLKYLQAGATAERNFTETLPPEWEKGKVRFSIISLELE